MKRVTDYIKRIGVMGLTAVMLVGQLPVTTFAAQVDPGWTTESTSLDEASDEAVSDNSLPAAGYAETELSVDAGMGEEQGEIALEESKATEEAAINATAADGLFLRGAMLSAQNQSITMSQAVVINSSNKSDYEGKTISGTIPGTSVAIRDGVVCSRGAIVVDGIELNLTIDGFSVDYSESVNMRSGISLVNGAQLHLTVKGTNTLKAGVGGAGIAVPGGCTLEITSASTGTLNAIGGEESGGGTGIGAVGSESNTGAFGSEKTCGTITINGGTVIAKGGSWRIYYTKAGGASAIGGSELGRTGTVIINGGVVRATAGFCAAAIGGGSNGTLERITITGGTIEATTDLDEDYAFTPPASIGAGLNSSTSETLREADITITGGQVTANGTIGHSGASGYLGGSVTIGGDADVTAQDCHAFTVNATIYDDYLVTGGTYSNATMTITGEHLEGTYSGTASISVTQNGVGTATFRFYVTEHLYNNCLMTLTHGGHTWTKNAYPGANNPISLLFVGSVSGGAITSRIAYIDEDGYERITDSIPSTLPNNGTADSGWYAVAPGTTMLDQLNINGTVHLILCDGADLQISKGVKIPNGKTLMIYAQSRDEDTMGQLVATGDQSAGIYVAPGGELYINGGKINATGTRENTFYNEASGIGGDPNSKNFGRIVINDGVVSGTASNSADVACGIGRGQGSSGECSGSIEINGGKVSAQKAGLGGRIFTNNNYESGEYPVTISWSHPDDEFFIYRVDETATIRFATGKYFVKKDTNTLVSQQWSSGNGMAVELLRATLVPAYKLTFDGNSGGGAMDDIGVRVNTVYTLPECGFTAPEGKVFDHWEIDGNSRMPGFGITMNGNKTVKAVWKQAPAVVPTITTQPADLRVIREASSGNVLTVAAETPTGHTLSYQWYSNTSAVNSGGLTISGATSASYSVDTGTVRTGYYYCVITATRTDNGETANIATNVATAVIDPKGNANLQITGTGVAGGAKTAVYGDTFTLTGTPASAGTGAATWSWTSSDTTVARVTAGSTTAIPTITILKATSDPVTIRARYESGTTEGEETLSLTALQKTVTVSDITAESKTYDGTTDATLVTSGATFDGKLDGDTLTISGSGEFDTADAGSDKDVTISGLTLGGASAANYVLDSVGQQTTTTADITKAAADLAVATTAYTGTFGDTAFDLEGITTTPADASLTYAVSDSRNAADSPVDNDKVITVNESGTVSILGAGSATITVSLPESTNYNAADSKTVTVTVGKKTADPVSAIDKTHSYQKGGFADIPLSALLPSDCGSVDYEVSTTGDLSYSQGPAVAGGVLSYTVNSGTENAQGSILVTAKTDNYADIAITVNLELVDPLQASVTTDPAPIQDLVYNGSAQALVTAGTADGGRLLYSLEQDGTYQATVPEAINAGDYEVWYYVDSDIDHCDSAKKSVSVSIAKAEPSIGEETDKAGNTAMIDSSITKAPIAFEVSIDGWTYGEDAAAPRVTGNSGNGAVTYEYKQKGAADSTYTATVPTASGEYTVRATVPATTNYQGAVATADFTISEKSTPAQPSEPAKSAGESNESEKPSADQEESTVIADESEKPAEDNGADSEKADESEKPAEDNGADSEKADESEKPTEDNGADSEKADESEKPTEDNGASAENTAQSENTSQNNTAANTGSTNTAGQQKVTTDPGKQSTEAEPKQDSRDAIRDRMQEAISAVLSDPDSDRTVVLALEDTSVVPGEVLDGIKGQDVSVVFDLGDGITWTINGKDITGDQIGDIDFSVSTGTDAIPVDVVNKVTGERYSKQISLAHDGEFGFTATLSVDMDPNNAGLYANLFYYDPDKGELEFICADEISEDGIAKLTFTHASDYTIIVDKEPMDGNLLQSEEIADAAGAAKVVTETDTQTGTPDPAGEEAADAKDAWSPWWFIVICGVVIAIGLGGCYIAKKKTLS